MLPLELAGYQHNMYCYSGKEGLPAKSYEESLVQKKKKTGFRRISLPHIRERN